MPGKGIREGNLHNSRGRRPGEKGTSGGRKFLRSKSTRTSSKNIKGGAGKEGGVLKKETKGKGLGTMKLLDFRPSRGVCLPAGEKKLRRERV